MMVLSESLVLVGIVVAFWVLVYPWVETMPMFGSYVVRR